MYSKPLFLLLFVFAFAACGRTPDALPTPLQEPASVVETAVSPTPLSAEPPSEPTNEPTKEPTEEPTAVSVDPNAPIVVQFAPNTDSITLEGVAHGINTPSYSLYAFGGQTMAVTIESAEDDVFTAVYAPNEQHGLDRMVEATSWEYYLPSTQSYIVNPRHNGSEPTPYSITIRIYNKEEAWQTFEDSVNGYTISYPADALFDASSGYVAINNQIFIGVGTTNPLACQGDCPLQKLVEPITIAGRPATKMVGELGAVGGNVPQEMLEYIFEEDGVFYVFTLYALDEYIANPDDWPEDRTLQAEDVTLFEEIVETFTLTQ